MNNLKRLQDLLAKVRLPPKETWKRFLSYEEAQRVVQAAGITSAGKHQRWKARPYDVPASPDRVYEGRGWRGWAHFFGTEYLPYDEARTAVHSAGIKSWSEFSRWKNRPKSLPSAPYSVYVEWKGWGEFVLPKSPRSLAYEKAQAVVRQAEIKTAREYQRWKDRPENVPAHPEVSYKNRGWQSWGDFLGTGSVVGSNAISYTGRQYLSYEEARTFVRAAEITTEAAFHPWFKKEHPAGMPSNPQKTYKGKGWTSWSEFFGTVVSPAIEQDALSKGVRA